MKLAQAPSPTSHRVDVSSLGNPDGWKELSARLAQGQSVYIPITPSKSTQLRGIIGSSVSQIPTKKLQKLNSIRADKVYVASQIRLQTDSRSFYVGGVALDKDTVKGGVVGGGVAGLVLSMADVSAKGVGGYAGMLLSCVALGAVIWPEVAARLRNSTIRVTPKGVEFQPPASGVPA